MTGELRAQSFEPYQIFSCETVESLRNAPFAQLFPGQGNLFKGMGVTLMRSYRDKTLISLCRAANRYYHEENPNDPKTLTDHIFNGDGSSLSRLNVSQPALALVNLTVDHVLRNIMHLHPAVAAGHSAGEYMALSSAGALSSENVLKVMVKRGAIAQTEVAAARSKGEPPTILVSLYSKNQIDETSIKQLLDIIGIDSRHFGIALINSPNSIVLWLNADKEEYLKIPGTRSIKLAIPSAFHAPLDSMRRTQEQMHEILSRVAWEKPEIPIILNYTGMPTTDVPTIINALVQNHTHTVQWYQSMLCLSRQLGIMQAVEAGPGKSLQAFFSQAEPSSKTHPTILKPY